MLIILTITLLFVLLALLTFFRNLILLFISSVINLFRKNKKTSDGDTNIRRNSSKKKKVFSKSEGEYVDYEEIKKKE